MRVYIKIQGNTREFAKVLAEINCENIEELVIVIDNMNRVLDPIAELVDKMDCTLRIMGDIPLGFKELEISKKVRLSTPKPKHCVLHENKLARAIETCRDTEFIRGHNQSRFDKWDKE